MSLFRRGEGPAEPRPTRGWEWHPWVVVLDEAGERLGSFPVDGASGNCDARSFGSRVTGFIARCMVRRHSTEELSRRRLNPRVASALLDRYGEEMNDAKFIGLAKRVVRWTGAPASLRLRVEAEVFLAQSNLADGREEARRRVVDGAVRLIQREPRSREARLSRAAILRALYYAFGSIPRTLAVARRLRTPAPQHAAWLERECRRRSRRGAERTDPRSAGWQAAISGDAKTAPQHLAPLGSDPGAQQMVAEIRAALSKGR